MLYDTAHYNPSINEGRYKAVSDLLRADGYEIVARRISAAGQSLRSSSEGQVLPAMGSASYDVLATKDTLSARGRAHAVALQYGAGRVVVIGDGSILSGFTYGPKNPRFRRWWPTDPHNRQFTLNVMHWLSGAL